jgi:nitroreductase
MSETKLDPSGKYAGLMDIIRRRRSVRRFEPGHAVDRSVLMNIAEAARWAPTGANSQCFDIIIIDDPMVREQTLDTFLAQSNRLIDHVKGFPAVKKTYSPIPLRSLSSWPTSAGR